MAAPKVTAVTPFIPRGTMRVVLLDAAPASTAPTRTEINDGVDLADEITGMEGFTFSTSYAEWPVLGKKKQIKLSASESLADSSLTFQRAKTGAGPHTLFTTGSTVYLVFMYGGDVAASKCDVWTCEVGGINPMPSFGDEPMTTKVDFGVINVDRDQAIPS